MVQRYLAEPFDHFAALVGRPEPGPAAGSVAAATMALAAALAAKAARLSAKQIDAADRLAGELDDLRQQVGELADEDARAYAVVLDAIRRNGRDGPGTRDAWRAAVAVPTEIARIGGEVARHAALLAADGNPNLAGDAITALLLADAATAAAAHLVEVNVTDAGLDTALIEEAAAHEQLVRALVQTVRPERRP